MGHKNRLHRFYRSSILLPSTIKIKVATMNDTTYQIIGKAFVQQAIITPVTFSVFSVLLEFFPTTFLQYFSVWVFATIFQSIFYLVKDKI